MKCNQKDPIDTIVKIYAALKKKQPGLADSCFKAALKCKKIPPIKDLKK